MREHLARSPRLGILDPWHPQFEHRVRMNEVYLDHLRDLLYHYFGNYHLIPGHSVLWIWVEGSSYLYVGNEVSCFHFEEAREFLRRV